MKRFTDLYTRPAFLADSIKPADVASLSVSQAAALACGKATPEAAGMALARAIVEASYGTPLTKAAIAAQSRSARARTIIAAWPKTIPACNNSRDEAKRVLLTPAQFNEAWKSLEEAFDKLIPPAKEKPEVVAPKDDAPSASEAEEVAAPTVSADDESLIAAMRAEIARISEQAAAMRAVLMEVEAYKPLPKGIKVKVHEALTK